MDPDPRGFPPGDLRVSDAERDLAVSELSRAFQVGRLTAEEFGQRTEQAFAARTGKELTAVLADLPVEPDPADTAVAKQADRHPPTPRAVVGATVAASLFALVALANAFTPGPTLQQRELLRQIYEARSGVSIPLPPAEGFNWAGTITPAIIAVAFVLLIIYMRAARPKRT
jgi:hypothetical protein